MNNCFSIHHTSWITSGPMSDFICENIATKAILFFFGCSEMNSVGLITSELANQGARKVLFTCVVYTNYINFSFWLIILRQGLGSELHTKGKRWSLSLLGLWIAPECKLTLEELASLRGRIKLAGLLWTWIVFRLIFSDKPGFYCYCSIHSRFIT